VRDDQIAGLQLRKERARYAEAQKTPGARSNRRFEILNELIRSTGADDRRVFGDGNARLRGQSRDDDERHQRALSVCGATPPFAQIILIMYPNFFVDLPPFGPNNTVSFLKTAVPPQVFITSTPLFFRNVKTPRRR
jgi:hypothetical protein